MNMSDCFFGCAGRCDCDRSRLVLIIDSDCGGLIGSLSRYQLSALDVLFSNPFIEHIGKLIGMLFFLSQYRFE